MKKVLLLFFIFNLSLFSLKAQLTNRQVYDFNAGDIIESKGQADANPPVYYLTIVLKKWTTVTGDSIYYVDSNVSYAVYPISFSAARDTVMITHLDSLATPGPIPSCDSTAIKDSVYNDSTRFCGKKVWIRSTPVNDTSFERQCGETSYTAYVVEGCGGSYGGWFDPSGPSGQSIDLIYYKKGTDSCGSYFKITGMNELYKLSASVKVYPNPNIGRFTIEEQGVRNKEAVEVYNVLGEKIYSSQFNIQHSEFNIDISSQPSGVYFVRLISDKATQIIKVVKE